MDARPDCGRRIEDLDYARACAPGIVDTDKRPAFRKIGCYQKATRAGVLRARGGLPIPDERDFARPGRFERRHTVNIEIAVAFPSRLQIARNFSDSQSRPP